MFEKIGDFFKKQFRNAFHAVTKSFTLFFPLVLSVLLIECMFFSVILAFDNNMKLQTEAVESTYDHHLVLSGLDNVETAFVGRHAARSESSTGNFIIKHNVGGTLYIKLLTGNTSISLTLFARCSVSGAMYLPVRRLARSPTWGCEISAGQRTEQHPQDTQSKDSSAHFSNSPL